MSDMHGASQKGASSIRWTLTHGLHVMACMSVMRLVWVQKLITRSLPHGTCVYSQGICEAE